MKSRLHHAPKASTMKCVRQVGQGVPIRMRTEDAFQLVVIDHDGEYCTKKFWKNWYDESGQPRAYRNIMDAITQGALLRNRNRRKGQGPNAG